MKKPLLSGSMAEEKEVSVGFQMFCVFIPFLDFWAFYRIKKFWLGMVAIGFVPVIVLFALGAGQVLVGAWDGESSPLAFSLASLSYVGLSLFFMRRWSIAWNEKATYQRRVF